MTNLTSRRGRRGAVVRERARRHRREAVVVALCGTVVVLVMGATASANAPSPVTQALQSGTVLINPNGTVTVNAHGLWVWPFGIESEHTAGLQASVRHKCDHRVGAGWGIIWNDPNDPGFSEAYHTKLKGRHRNLSLTVNVGSKGVNPANTDNQVQYDTSHPCGMFVQTNVPAPGDGYDVGAWAARHTYANVAALPSEICLVTYDLGVGKAPQAHRVSFTNNDNSVQWQLVNMGGYSTAVTGKNCNSLPPPVKAPPVPPATIVPVSKTTHNPPPPTTPPARVVTTSSHTLAFTGVGNTGRLVAVLGALLVLLGMLVYFVDIRRATGWLLGASSRPSRQPPTRHQSAAPTSLLPRGTWSRDAMERGRVAGAARAARAAQTRNRGMTPGMASPGRGTRMPPPGRGPGTPPRAAPPPGRRPLGGRGGPAPRRPPR